MGVLRDCHVQVKRILPDDDFVKPQKEEFLTGMGDEDGVLSGRRSFVKISNVLTLLS